MSRTSIWVCLVALAAPAAAQWRTGYFWQGDVQSVAAVPWSNYTHVIHYALRPTFSNGVCGLDTTQGLLRSADIEAFVNHAHAAGVKAMIGIRQDDALEAIAICTAPDNVAQFVERIRAFVATTGYDGVDLHWETNTIPSQYQDLVRRLRTALPTAILSVLVGLGERSMIAAVQHDLDQINIRADDLDSQYHAMEILSREYVYAGNASFKLGLAVPFYSRIRKGCLNDNGTNAVTDPNQPGVGHTELGLIVYRDLVNSPYWSLGTRVWDDSRKSQYIQYRDANCANDALILYVGSEQLHEVVALIGANKLGGIATFGLPYEYIATQAGDARYPLSTTIYNAVVDSSSTAPQSPKPSSVSTTLPTTTAATAQNTAVPTHPGVPVQVARPRQLAAAGAQVFTYYVDSANGSDSNPGTQALPWKTIAKVNKTALTPGQSVGFARGGMWRETLQPGRSGTAGNPITFGAYGTGASPKILGSDSRSGTNNWTSAGPSLWSSTAIVSSDPKALFHDGLGGRRKASTAALAAEWDWSYDVPSSRIFVRLSHNPGQSNIEISQRLGIGWAWASYVTVRDLEIAYANFGIGLYGATNWTVDNVFLHDIAVDSIQGNGGARQNVIQNCTIRDWNWHGYKMSLSSGQSYMGYGIHVLNTQSVGNDGWIIQANQLSIQNMDSGDDTTAIAIDSGGYASSIANNHITGKSSVGMGGIMFWRPQGVGPAQIQGNWIQNIGSMGINVSELSAFGYNNQITVDHNVLLNTCGTDALDEEALRVWTANTALITLRDNLIAGTAQGIYSHPGIRIRQSRAVAAENTVWGTDSGFSIERGSTDVTLFNNISAGNRNSALAVDSTSACVEHNNDWSGVVSGWKKDSTSLSIDPQFVNASDGNFHLSPGSPVIGKGAPAYPAYADFDGVMRPVAGSWDPGAYEYKPAVQVSSATVVLTPNLLNNAGFEQGTLAGWENYGGITVTPGSAYSGSFGATMSTSGRIDQRFPTVPGQTYYVSVRIRIDRQVVLPPWGGIAVQFVNSNWATLAASPYLTAVNSPPGIWTRISLSFVATTAESRVVYQNFGSGQFSVSADEFIVSPMPIQ